MGEIINGKQISLSIKEEIKQFVINRKNQNKSLPKIASVLVGNDGGSIYYMNSQEKTALSLGVLFEKVILPEDIKEADLLEEIKKLNSDDSISGIIMQLPLPKHISEKNIVNSIASNKDIDCLKADSIGKMYMGEDSFMPCTPLSVITLIKSLNIDIQGKKAVVIGRSNIVGKPAFELLLRENATVTMCHSKTKNLKEITSSADILVSAIGKPKFIDDSYIKDGAIVIDVGTSRFEGKITGDVDFDKVIDKASYVTPVPGGVGALTTTLLIKNACEALIKNEN